MREKLALTIFFGGRPCSWRLPRSLARAPGRFSRLPWWFSSRLLRSSWEPLSPRWRTARRGGGRWSACCRGTAERGHRRLALRAGQPWISPRYRPRPRARAARRRTGGGSVSYTVDWIAGAVFLGAALLLLIVPSFALIGLLVVALAALAALVALAGAMLAMPYLLVHSLRRRLAEPRRPTDGSLPTARAIAQTRRPTKRSGVAAL